MSDVKVAIVDDPDLTKEQRLHAALDRAGFWDIVERACQRSANRPRVIIKPDLGGFALGSPTVTDPELVEALVDALHDRGYPDVSIGSAAEESAVWAENRDVFALTELLGYRFVTPKGRPYEVDDLSANLEQFAFPNYSGLHGTSLSTAWFNADIRIVFSKNKTDEEAHYALCLESLVGVLPLADKHLHYRAARDTGEVLADLLTAAPVHFALIDAINSAHGTNGRRAPNTIATATIIASPTVCLTDQIGALKMGLDPYRSPVFAKVVARHPIPARYEIDGSLSVFADWRNVPEAVVAATRYRAGTPALERLVKPWLQSLDTELFPLKGPFDAQINAYLAEFFRDADSSTTSRGLLILLNVAAGFLGHLTECYRTLFDKDSLRQKAVGLGVDPTSFGREEFNPIVGELLQFEALVAEAPEAAPGLRWRYLDSAVLFSYSRSLPIEFEIFTKRVDVARTIQFMNDYLGGVVKPVEHDDAGRPVRQVERNLYLPQPNYLVIYHGKPIDVTKLEVAEYNLDRHRLFWKTIRSENSSATFDDGIATFSRCPEGTEVTIVGRQLFALPSFWKLVDLDAFPGFKAALVTHAYRVFFDRTIANFEALVEGRDVRLGRPADEPDQSPVDAFLPLVQMAGEALGPLMENLKPGIDRVNPAPTAVTDADGFVHMRPGSVQGPEATSAPVWQRETTRFLQGLLEAIQSDLRHRSRA